MFRQEPTGLPLETLKLVGEKICQVPAGFVVHEHFRQIFQDRLQMIEGPQGRVNWAMAEALAFGTLVLHRYAHGVSINCSKSFFQRGQKM